MAIHLMPTPIHPVTACTLTDLRASCAGVREAIAETSSVREAFTLYRSLHEIAAELAGLVDVAAARCETLLDKL